jgi:hypothetical protein
MVVLACGCSGGSDGEGAPTTTAQPTVTTRPPATASTTTTTIPDPLEPLILKVAPSGFPRQDDSFASTGPVDLEKAVLDDPFGSADAARRTLLAAGFVRGYQRQWTVEPGVNQNFIYVYQFATPEGAASYLTHWRAVAVAGPFRRTPVPFTPVLPGATGLKGNDGRGSSGLVLVSKGPYAVQAVVTGPPAVQQAEPATQLAFAQYALLP